MNSTTLSNYYFQSRNARKRFNSRIKAQHHTNASLFKTMVFSLGLFLIFALIGISFFTQQVLSSYNQYFSKPNLMLAFKSNALTFLDRNGQVIYRTAGRYNTEITPLEKISPSLVQATIAAEDKDFYEHEGFSLSGTARALFHDVSKMDLYNQGGSTITQQLARNFFLTQDKSFTRKVKELILSFELERRYSKDEILELYLNSIYYGAGAYGAPEAAKIYFNKDVKDLTLAESSLLAGLPASPSQLSPLHNTEDKALKRRDYVLEMMKKNNYVSDKEITEAKEKTLVYNTTTTTPTNAPHFVLYLKNELSKLLPNTEIENSGLVIQTTLDLNLQKKAETLVKTKVEALKNRHVTNGAFYASNPTTGEILTMVGSVDFNQPDWGSVNILTSPRSPGSAIKPVIYASALASGKITLGTVLEDKPVKYPDGDETYAPTDADGKFRGSVLPRQALANSLNIPAVEVLAKTGLPTAVDWTKKFGFLNIGNPTDYGLSFALGGMEIRGIDLASSYGVFANGGDLIKPWGIKEVKDRFGKQIYENQIEKKNILDAKTSYLITNVLSDNKAREMLFGPRNPLVLDRPAAAKTGTAQDFKNTWTVGYTPQLLALSWFGNNDGSPMENIWGLESAALIWNDFMKTALAGAPKEEFKKPEGIQTASVCKLDGSKAEPGQPSASELFLNGSEPKNSGACTFMAQKHEEEKHLAEEEAKKQAEEDEIEIIGGPVTLPYDPASPPDEKPKEEDPKTPKEDKPPSNDKTPTN